MIIFSVFQHVSINSPRSGVGKIALELFRLIKSESKSVEIYFGKKGELDEKGIKDLGSVYYLFYYIIEKLIKKNHIKRYIQEVLYDFILSTKVKNSVKVIVTTNAWIPLTAKKAKKKGIRLILIAGNPNDNFIRNLVSKEKKKVGLHSTDVYDFNKRINSYNSFITKVDKIICINDYIYNSYVEQKFHPSLLELVPTIYDANYDKFKGAEKSVKNFTVLYFAHTTLLKGLQYLIEAFQLLNSENKDIQLKIIGNIDDSLVDLTTEISKLENVELLGTLESDEIAFHLQTSAIYVLPSLTDAAPVSLVEALYTATPVVISSGVGHKWLINNYSNGFVYDKFDVNELVDVIKFGYENRDELEKIGQRGKQSLEKVIRKKDTAIKKISNVIKTYR